MQPRGLGADGGWGLCQFRLRGWRVAFASGVRHPLPRIFLGDAPLSPFAGCADGLLCCLSCAA